MAKKYYPSAFQQIHDLNVYFARYNSVLLATIAVVDPEAVVVYIAVRDAVAAFDALRAQFVPVLPDAAT
jgi:hypothetical protein